MPFIRPLGVRGSSPKGLLSAVGDFQNARFNPAAFFSSRLFFPVSTSVWGKSCQSMAQGLTNIVK